MTPETSSKDVVRASNDIVSSGDLDELDELVDENVVLQWPGEEAFHGLDAYKAGIQEVRSAFPDFTIETTELIAEGDTVVSRYTFRGTHEGEFDGIEPTGKTVENDVLALSRVKDGKIVEDIHFWDNMTSLQQLGVLE